MPTDRRERGKSMQSKNIKNVVFDIGNVIVRWSPLEITRLTFGEVNNLQPRCNSIFQSDIWLDLNKGKITEQEAKSLYQQSITLSELECERLFYYVKQTQILLYGSIDLLKRVKAAGYNVYALTDNVTDIVEHLKSTYSFWSEFDGTIVSADLGVLKPQAEIYHALLNQYSLQAKETVFLDDMPNNVKGAESVGMYAIQFLTAEQCEKDLKELGVLF